MTYLDTDSGLPDPYILAMSPESGLGADTEPEYALGQDFYDDDEEEEEDPEEEDPEEVAIERAEWVHVCAETLATARVLASSSRSWASIWPPETIGPYTESLLEQEGLSAIVRFELNDGGDRDLLAITLDHEGDESEICFRPGGSSRLTAIHEVAHVALGVPPGYYRGDIVASHGPDFVATQLRLLAKYAGARIARLHRLAYEELGVPVPPKEKRPRRASGCSAGGTSPGEP